ncbi:MAG: hypothetical protein JJLCMIEE_00557 [Acidimicrobiales bacterium]|nr:MAG: hypothetical protein EDR02_04365 [Actinomycetota bacterium]MBV6507508.1 hypothetical protein [Acidimicrobiales bacterium]RIK07884.1 MAG: hypothetical protein DCC48_02730 [Acidobacteriota bacterium]
MTDAATPEELATVARLVDVWLEQQLEANPIVAGVECDHSGDRVWFVRLRGEQKPNFAVWFRLRQRTLHFETYFTPAPERNQQMFYEHLLRRNLKMYGAAFAIGEEDAVFLLGRLPVSQVDEAELDRVLGSLYAYVEQYFRPALRIGFRSPP